MDAAMHRDLEAQRILTQYGKLLDTIADALLPGHPEEAEECVQDAIWAYVEGRQRWDPARGSEKTYLCVLVRSRARDRRRRLAARVARLRKKLKHLLAQQGLGWDGKEDTK